ncbi:MAG TPA: ABC transporter substrate-binding protein [Rhizomicrobium sp.]|jgi:iron complex transport system substrate-binding protein
MIAGRAWKVGLALWLAASSFAAAAPVQPKPRVASVTVCGDMYALMLADRSQIAAVSPEADGPLAYYPERARGLARNRGDLEALIAAHADVVLLEEGGKPQLVRALRRLGIKTIILPTSVEFSDIAKTVQTVADALGQHARGEMVATDMMRRVHKLEAARPPESKRPIALYFRPDGGGGAKGTFMNSMVELAGFRNQQVMLGQKGWKGIPLESIVETPPQIFIAGFFDTQSKSLTAVRGSKLNVVKTVQAPVMSLPGKGMVCASPALVASAEQAADIRRRLFPESADAR